MKILVFSTLYPNSMQSRHGIFVEQRLRKLLALEKLEAKVVAPVPWYPLPQKLFSTYDVYAQVPNFEQRYGIDIIHPRYPSIPKIGMTIAPYLMYLALRPVIRKIIDNGFDFDILDAHYFYPDGVAAVLLAQYFDKPVVITARGTDINLIPKYRLPRAMILRAAEYASGVITVCEALKQEMVRMGASAENITALRNGVDLDTFSPIDRQAQRKKLRLNRTTLLSVGHLIERKGHHIIIEALTQLPDVDLLIVGDGEEEKNLKALAKRLSVEDRVRFLGPIPQEELKNYYGAVDALVLASSREGWANVLLEAMACGTPVIATNVWGTPEVISTDKVGVLMEERTPEALVKAFNELLGNKDVDYHYVRKYAEGFGWEETSSGQYELFERIMKQEES